MAINVPQLISAAMLQDYFVDKVLGTPLSGGIVTMYQDKNRQKLKNWYYQSGTPGAYTYIALPNPMTLSGVGTIVDVGGNDVIPFYYPYSEEDGTTQETYYITVYDDEGELQFTRSNFPFLGNSNSSQSNPTLRNYIANNRFWRNIGTSPFSLGGLTQQVVCPSQHDGFQFPDITFQKDTTTATETVSFPTFPQGVLTFPTAITPLYYLEHSCTVASTTENYKRYLFPVSFKIQTLESQKATFTFWAANLSTAASLPIGVSVFQDLGTNTTNPLSPEQTFPLTTTWQQFIVPFTFPSGEGKTLSPTGDDALYIAITLPINAIFDIGIALPSLFLGNDLATNDFNTFDEADTIINSPRTGDIRTSLNSFGGNGVANFGWVPAMDGTIGLTVGTARFGVDTWQLYSLLWNNVTDTYAPVSTGRGTTAYDDFVANKTIQLTLALGRVFAGGWNNTPQVLGFTEGSSTSNALLEHTHPFTSDNDFVSNNGTQSILQGGAPYGVTDHVFATGTTGSAGSGTSFSIMQPTTFYNVYFKL